jgi:protocatechuate 3,4-dioxygenase beta subunit
MRKSIFVTFILACFIFSAIQAADDSKGRESETAKISISGTVVDEATGESLAGVSVSLEGTDRTVYTDFDGKYKFTGVAPGEYTLKTTFISYKAFSSKVNAKPDNKNALDVKLKTSAM